jgi:glycosyltransferase involved in cell wall biosynthesis
VNPVDVSVLVPVLDEERHLRAAVERMLAQRFDGELEFLFIDGGSQDASRAILAELAAADPRVHVLENPHRRTPHALNIGLRAARGEFVARMDAHTNYPPDYLALGVERLRRGGAVSVSGPQIAVGDGPWSRRAALALSTSLGVGGASFRRASDEEFEVDTGFTGLWRRSTLTDAGGWDEEWLTDQDCELAFRLSAHGGHHVCLPAMAAEYIPRDSLQRLGRQYWQYGLHKVKTFRRHPRAMRPSHLLPPALAATTVVAVAAPGRPVRRAARAGLGLYGAALAATAVGAARRAPAADAAALPLVYGTMHLAYGFGLFAGVRRYGVPAAAVSGAVGRAVRRP